MTSEKPWELVGRARDDESVQNFLRALRVAPRRDSFGGLEIEDYPELGFAIYFTEAKRVRSVFFFAGGEEGAAQYSGSLPGDLAFDFGRGDVIARLGRPDKSGVDWDRFPRGAAYIHVTYTRGGGGISKITAFPWE